MARTVLRAGRRVVIAEVIALFEDAGFFAIDLGSLMTGGEMQQIGGPLAGVNLIRLAPASDR